MVRQASTRLQAASAEGRSVELMGGGGSKGKRKRRTQQPESRLRKNWELESRDLPLHPSPPV